MSVKEKIGKILLSEEAILERVRELGCQISNDYRGKRITIVCVLKGAVVFLADLIRNLDIPVELDFVSISSYGDGIESIGSVEVPLGLTANIEGQDVLIVEDIIDSGLTLHFLRDVLLAKRPASLRICTLLDKTGSSRTRDVKVDYLGFKIPDEFVIGYGLDYAGKYRGLRYIASLERA